MNTRWRPPVRDFVLAVALVLAAALPAMLRAAPAAATPAATAAPHPSPSDAHGTPAARPAALSPGELRRLLAEMPAGDARRGEQLHRAQFCASCHGAAGVAPTPNWPHVAGQRAAYTYKTLVDYQRGIRAEGERAALMRDAVHGMTPQDMADIAAWYARLPLPREAETPRLASPAATQAGVQTLVRHGDPARLITPCASCHGARGQGGVNGTPALAGQNPQYFVRTLDAYHGGLRANDAQRGMRTFAARLSSQEMRALAAYYADLPIPR